MIFINSTKCLNSMNPINYMDPLNSMNLINTMNSLNYMNSLNSMNSITYMDSLNSINSMKHRLHRFYSWVKNELVFQHDTLLEKYFCVVLSISFSLLLSCDSRYIFASCFPGIQGSSVFVITNNFANFSSGLFLVSKSSHHN